MTSLLHQRHGQKQERYLLPTQHTSFSVSLPKWARITFYFVHHTGRAHEEQEEDPRVTKILNFFSECNIAIPSSRRKLTIKFVLEKLQELKQLVASIPAPSLSSASSPSLTLPLLIVVHLPPQKDALLSHFAEVAEALSQSTTLITPPPLKAFSLRQK